MSSPKEPAGERTNEEVSADLVSLLTARLTARPQDVDVLREHGSDEVATQLVDRRERKKRKPRVKKVVDWSTPPYVDPDAAGDFRDMMSGKYEGMDEEQARKRFTKHGLDFDTCTAAELAEQIRAIRSDVGLSDSLGPACFVFCEAKIPEAHREGWTIAIMAARDVHEDD